MKTTAGRTFVAVDGGISDDLDAVTGLHCDSGDVLGTDVSLPDVSPGDRVGMAGTGAYTFSLASNDNTTPRPAVVEVGDGSAKVVVRRETVADLLSRQVW